MGRESVSNNPSVNITQIKKGSVISGNMKSKHSIRVDGQVTGDLASDEKIIVGIHGEIGGNLSGVDITVEGYVNGDVMATANLHVSNKAAIAGQIFAKEISIDKGAQLNGNIAVGTDVNIPGLDLEEPIPSSTKEVSVGKVDAQKASGTVAW